MFYFIFYTFNFKFMTCDEKVYIYSVIHTLSDHKEHLKPYLFLFCSLNCLGDLKHIECNVPPY